MDRIVRDQLGEPLLVHSTSWRRDREAVILSFVVVIGPELMGAGLPCSVVDVSWMQERVAVGESPDGRDRALPDAPVLIQSDERRPWTATATDGG